MLPLIKIFRYSRFSFLKMFDDLNTVRPLLLAQEDFFYKRNAHLFDFGRQIFRPQLFGRSAEELNYLLRHTLLELHFALQADDLQKSNIFQLLRRLCAVSLRIVATLCEGWRAMSLDQSPDKDFALDASRPLGQLVKRVFEDIERNGLSGVCPQFEQCLPDYEFIVGMESVMEADSEEFLLCWKTIEAILKKVFGIIDACMVLFDRIEQLLDTITQLPRGN